MCDPSVVAGDFRRGGARYGYALFFLGNDVDASRHNQIGVALANEFAGPWTRLPHPVVPHDDPHAWGVGQPSALSLDRCGRILLFYTCGDREGTRILVRTIDLSDAEKPATSPLVTLTTAGLAGTDGRPDWFNNADAAFDAGHARLLCVREQHPYPRDNPRYIGTSLQIASIPAPDALRGKGRWTIEGAITPDVTGFARNHNAGFVRGPFGDLPEHGRVRVVFASSAASSAPGRMEWTYDLWQIDGVSEP